MIQSILKEKACLSRNSKCLYYGNRWITFGDMEERCNKVALFLAEIGVKKGDKVCLMLSNGPEFLEMWFGLSKVGAVMIPLDASGGSNNFNYIVHHSDAEVLTIDESNYVNYENDIRSICGIRNIIWVGSSVGMPEGSINYQDALDAIPRNTRDDISTCPLDIMSIIYTSGTTGPPKGVLISQFNYVNTGKIWAEIVIRQNSDDVFFTNLPMSDINTQMFIIMAALTCGRPVVLGKEFDATKFLAEVRDCGATIINYTGPMLAKLIAQVPREDDARNPIRIAFGGGVVSGIRDDVEKRFSLNIMEGLAVTECGGMYIANTRCGGKTGSVGTPLPFCKVKVVDEFDRELPAGISGEIVVRPEKAGSIFMGYYKESERTNETMRSGWFHTGDRGYVDEEGYFYFLDRMEDCIQSRGQHVSSLEIESIINAHPDVLDSAVIGVSSDLEMMEIKAIVVLGEGVSISPETIIEWCANRMPSTFVPHYVEFVSGLPKTATMRTQKFRLRTISNRNYEGEESEENRKTPPSFTPMRKRSRIWSR